MQEKRDLRSFKNKQQAVYSRQNPVYEPPQLRAQAEPTAEQALNDPEKSEDLGRLQSVLGQYEGKSENELMSELANMTRKNKEEGKLDNNRLMEMSQKIAPMLDDTQRDKMQTILEQLKKM